jgi:predicted Zn-dependent protease
MELDKESGAGRLFLRASANSKKENFQLLWTILIRQSSSTQRTQEFCCALWCTQPAQAVSRSLEAVQKRFLAQNSSYHLNYAYFLSRVGDYEGSRRELAELDQTTDKSVWYTIIAGFSQQMTKTYATVARAEEAMKEALQLLPNDPRLWDTQAAVCAEQSFEQAVKWEKRASRQKPLLPSSGQTLWTG